MRNQCTIPVPVTLKSCTYVQWLGVCVVARRPSRLFNYASIFRLQNYFSPRQFLRPCVFDFNTADLQIPSPRSCFEDNDILNEFLLLLPRCRVPVLSLTLFPLSCTLRCVVRRVSCVFGYPRPRWIPPPSTLATPVAFALYDCGTREWN